MALLMLLPASVLMSGCGKRYTCYECGDTVKTAYYDMDFRDDYVLCESCAEIYWWPFDYTEFEVTAKKGNTKKKSLEADIPKNEIVEMPAEPAEEIVCSEGIGYKDGYYAIVDSKGNPLTGYIYDSAEGFVNGYCIVGKGNVYGMVDPNGVEVLPVKYAELYFTGDMICFKTNRSYAYSGLGLMDMELNVVVPENSGVIYDHFTITDKYIYAKEHNHSFCDMFDLQGNDVLDTLPGNGVLVLDGYDSRAHAVKAQPPVNGIIKVKYESPAERGNNQNYHYCYMDEDLNLITDRLWEDGTDFNVRGYAAAHECEFRYHINGIYTFDSDWYLVGKDGSLAILPEASGDLHYVYADPYFAVTFIGGFYSNYYLIDLSTGEKTTLSAFEEIDGCLVVKDKTSGLYGLVDGNALVLDFRYSDIDYQDGVFHWTEGAESGIYTPKGFVPLVSSAASSKGANTAPAEALTPANTPAPVVEAQVPAVITAPVETPTPVSIPAPVVEAPVPAVSADHIYDVYASSVLVEPACTHSADRIIDGQMRTAWVEGAEGQGYGESVTIEFDSICAVSQISIASGYQLDETRYTINSRPKQLELIFSNGDSVILSLEDTMGIQNFTFIEPVETEFVTFVILDVYPGSLCEDTCITDVSFA